MGKTLNCGQLSNSFEEKGFLKSIEPGKEKLYQNHELMDII
jgi:hypothetical protein